jgi:hypothetical protein
MEETMKTVLITGLILGAFAAQAFTADYGMRGQDNQPPQDQQNQRPQQNRGQGNGSSRVPPDSAISACSGKSEGTACTVIGPNGSKQGVCAYTPDKKYYACKPNDMNMPSQPPQR